MGHSSEGFVEKQGRPRSKNDAVWMPGQSGNPKGRPKRKSISECIEEILRRVAPGSDGKTFREVLAEVVVRKALKGEYRFIREIWDRLEGKPLERYSVENEPDLQRDLQIIEAELVENLELIDRLKTRAGYSIKQISDGKSNGANSSLKSRRSDEDSSSAGT